MKNNVFFETACKIKELGFPQPKPEFGQMWWYSQPGSGIDPELCVCSYSIREDMAVAERPDGTWDFLNEPDCWTFAPIATDILRELWFGFDLKCGGNKKWVVCERSVDEINVVSEHENPAEACASVWMEVKSL